MGATNRPALLVHFALLGAGVLAARVSAAQSVQHIDGDHVTIGATIGIYPTGGGFGLGDQALEYQGVHLDAVRLGFSQLVAHGFRMELAALFGLSLLADPGFVPNDPNPPDASSRVGFHFGVGLGGYYRFPVGVTLGFGGEIDFGFGEFLDTTFFRAVPAVGYEWADPLGAWFLHVRWIVGLTLLAGLEEHNRLPESNLTTTAIQVTYGF